LETGLTPENQAASAELEFDFSTQTSQKTFGLGQGKPGSSVFFWSRGIEASIFTRSTFMLHGLRNAWPNRTLDQVTGFERRFSKDWLLLSRP